MGSWWWKCLQQLSDRSVSVGRDIVTTSFVTCRYPGTTFMDHIVRYHDDQHVKMIVVLGEVIMATLQ